MKLLIFWFMAVTIASASTEDQDTKKQDLGYGGGLGHGNEFDGSHPYLESSTGRRGNGFGSHDNGRSASVIVGGHELGFGVSLGYGDGQSYQKTIRITKEEPVSLLNLASVPLVRKVRVPGPKAIPYPVERPYQVPAKEPVPIEKQTPYPERRQDSYPEHVPVSHSVPAPVPKSVDNPISVPEKFTVPQLVPVYKNVPIYIQCHGHEGRANYNGDYNGRGSDYRSGNNGGYRSKYGRRH